MPRRRRPRAQDIDGLVLLDKPAGMTSNTALQRVRGILNARKAGHTGSLDPFATGVLPICLGRATRVSSVLLDADKTYTATIALGTATDSGDCDGEVCAEKAPPAHWPSKVESVLQSFLGNIEQTPSAYSAIRINGERAYALARAGEKVDMPSRRVTIYDLSALDVDASSLSIRVRCSKGTYIRSLGQDIAQALGGVGHLTHLRREHCAPFDILSAVDLDTLSDNPTAALRPLGDALVRYPAAELQRQQALRLQHGNPAQPSGPLSAEVGQWLRLNYRGYSLGLGCLNEEGFLIPKRMFVGPEICIDTVSA